MLSASVPRCVGSDRDRVRGTPLVRDRVSSRSPAIRFTSARDRRTPARRNRRCASNEHAAPSMKACSTPRARRRGSPKNRDSLRSRTATRSHRHPEDAAFRFPRPTRRETRRVTGCASARARHRTSIGAHRRREAHWTRSSGNEGCGSRFAEHFERHSPTPHSRSPLRQRRSPDESRHVSLE